MRTQVFAHRGVHHDAPENSMAAFHAALEAGADGIETDVQLDCHGTPILFHNRILKGGRPVATLSREELSQAVGYEVPGLQEALADVSDICWNIEIKTMDAVRPAIDIMRSFIGKRDMLVSSFIHLAVDCFVREIAIPGALLVCHSPNGPLLNSLALAPGVEGIVWDCGTVNPKDLEWAKSVGLSNRVYGFQSSAEHAPFVRADVAAIITDFPAALIGGD